MLSPSDYAKEGGDYQVKDPEKLLRIAKEWGVETEGKDIYDLAHEMADLGLMKNTVNRSEVYPEMARQRCTAGQTQKLWHRRRNRTTCN